MMVFKRIVSVLLVLAVSVVCFNCTANAAVYNADINTTSKAVYLMNLDTEITVYEKNAQERLYPASTTKIMTYIVVAENVSDIKGTKVVIDKEILDELTGTGSSLSGLEHFVGQAVTVYDLLNCLMIKSGNDAALILANYIGDGSTQKFVDMMNEKAQALGCKNTNFTNPHGLHDDNHYTTAEDLAIITRYAQTLPEFNEICSTVTAYLSVDAEKEYPLITTNYLIDEKRGGEYYYSYAKGGKTGTTDEAGYCLVSTAAKDGYTYLCIALGSPSVDVSGNEVETNGAMTDSIALYDWAFTNLQLKSVIDEQTPVCEIPIDLAWDQDTIQLVPQGSYTTLLPADVESSSIDIITDIPQSVTAPIIEGSVIGKATISYANQELTTVNLVAAESVNRSKILYFLEVAKKILKSKWMVLSIVVVVVLLGIYSIITIIYNQKKSKNKKMKNKKKTKSSAKKTSK